MSLPCSLRRFAARPAWGCAALALVLRTALVLHAWTANPLVTTPQLDGPYYVRWAADIAQGDVAGTGGIVGGAPWVLNPLYAYVLAPFAAVFSNAGDLVLPVILFQALLGAATTALAAAAATRYFDRRAGWVAGLLVAFAAPLAQLDAHIGVAELSAFLVAGACFASAPSRSPQEPSSRPSSRPYSDRRGDRRGAHGPVAAGLWLGIGALARPITPLALPFVAWQYASGTPRRWRAGIVVVAVFAACAVPSFVRNWAVSGEPAVYTAAGGINAFLGNNPEARRLRAMASNQFQFNPSQMYDGARSYVEQATGRRPSFGEMSQWFWRVTLTETVEHPAASAAHYANKARWFFGPVEVPSSASLATDRSFSPFLALACVPAWLVASLAAAGAWVHRRRADVLLGPGALALAHWGMLTLVFPLSHYRAPAIPALAVLAGGAVAAAWASWTQARRGVAATVLCVGAAAAVAGAVPPQPDPAWMRDEMVLAKYYADRADLVLAERHARAAADAHRRQWGEESGIPWSLIGDIQTRQRRWQDALPSLDRALELDPNQPYARLLRSIVHERLGNLAAAEKDARDVTVSHPGMWEGHERLGRVLWFLPDRLAETTEAFRKAVLLGADVNPAVLQRLGIVK